MLLAVALSAGSVSGQSEHSDSLWLITPGKGNIGLIEILTAQGDDITSERIIDHKAFFRTRHQAAKFIADVSGMGFSSRYASTSNRQSPYPFEVRFSRRDQPIHEIMDPLTYHLAILCIGCGGEYGGWECQVVRNDYSR